MSICISFFNALTGEVPKLDQWCLKDGAVIYIAVVNLQSQYPPFRRHLSLSTNICLGICARRPLCLVLLMFWFPTPFLSPSSSPKLRCCWLRILIFIDGHPPHLDRSENAGFSVLSRERKKKRTRTRTTHLGCSQFSHMSSDAECRCLQSQHSQKCA